MFLSSIESLLTQHLCLIHAETFTDFFCFPLCGHHETFFCWHFQRSVTLNSFNCPSGMWGIMRNSALAVFPSHINKAPWCWLLLKSWLEPVNSQQMGPDTLLFRGQDSSYKSQNVHCFNLRWKYEFSFFLLLPSINMLFRSSKTTLL